MQVITLLNGETWRPTRRVRVLGGLINHITGTNSAATIKAPHQLAAAGKAYLGAVGSEFPSAYYPIGAWVGYVTIVAATYVLTVSGLTPQIMDAEWCIEFTGDATSNCTLWVEDA